MDYLRLSLLCKFFWLDYFKEFNFLIYIYSMLGDLPQRLLSYQIHLPQQRKEKIPRYQETLTLVV